MEIEIMCGCGRVLDGALFRGAIQVDPCPDCLEEAKDEAYDEGLKEGKEEAENG